MRIEDAGDWEDEEDEEEDDEEWLINLIYYNDIGLFFISSP